MAERFSIGAMISALRKRLQPATATEGAREGAEETSKALPAALMPREAVLRKRKQLQDLDEQTKDH